MTSWLVQSVPTLLAIEDTTTFMLARYYEMRWRIEDFHKAWKSGVGVEDQRMQSIDNLEEKIVILSFVAIRILQLKEDFEYQSGLNTHDNSTSCDELLTESE